MMPDAAPGKPWLEPLAAILDACGAGRLPPEVALMRLIMAAGSEAAFEAVLLDAGQASSGAAARRLADLVDLARRHPQAWRTVRATAAAVPHGGAAGRGAAAVRRLAASFDRAAAISPEASVALYSLGAPERLAAATAEIASWLAGRGLLGKDRHILDLGCGIGRLELALHDKVGRIVGVDVSPEMVRLAAERTGGLSNVDIRLTSGLDLAGLPDARFHAVLAIDTFPYLVAAGLAEDHLRECARVLRMHGEVAICNYSYRGSPAEGRAALRRGAAAAGLKMVEDGTQPFRLWDGTAFRLAKAG